MKDRLRDNTDDTPDDAPPVSSEFDLDPVAGTGTPDDLRSWGDSLYPRPKAEDDE